MTKFKTLFLLPFFLFIVSGKVFALSSGDLAQFEKANKAYRDGQFDEAAVLYQTLAKAHPGQAAFHYNLGNALFRKGERGEAILAYERARLQKPRSSDILSNLNYLNGLLEYRIEDKRNWYIRFAEKLLGYFTEQELTLAALLMSFLFFGSWVITLFFRQDISWKPFQKMLLFLSLLTLLLVTVKMIQIRFFKEAIVTAKQAQVYYGPSVNDQPAFRLGEGLKTYIVDERQHWNRILIASGESGWIQKEHLKAIK